jgi:light-regulated signal transduction histidine kinase (bacteriophytochrome)
MVINQRSVGIISFVTAESGRRYSASDLQTAEELARRAATALENARLYKQSQHAQAELEERNQELRRANEDLNQFAYSASHDLQEPLRMVSIYSQLLRKQYGDRLDSRAHQYLQYSIDGSRRMETLLADIRAYTQAATPGNTQTEAVDSNVVLEKALVNLEGGIAESGAQITHDPLPVLNLQEVHLLQLFQNLIGNSIKYRSKEAPVIAITARREPDSWLFSVRDNGIGIDPQYKEQIFGLFKRLHSREDYAGTGVGLAICQKIVERYRGRIWVESELGRGSTFFFTLPAAG